MEKKLQVRDLRISFRTVSGKLQAVRNISFDLTKGETLAIVGESGSGKSVTSKAILGILAGNAMVEGGEILYDGQDLLKINEEDFYKIRGDKISMIFQDPLSSLNPIMRIGKQLTEAMLLKGKARQRFSKASYHFKLDLLEKYMRLSRPGQEEAIRKKCSLFRRFERRHVSLKQAYDSALEAAQEALVEMENILFLIEKNAFTDARISLAEVQELCLKSMNPYVVSDRAAEVKNLAGGLLDGLQGQIRNGKFDDAALKLAQLRDLLKEAVSKPVPDFFALGYFEEKGTGEKPRGTMDEQNAFYARRLAEEFMDDFLLLAESGVKYNQEKYLKLREKAVQALDQTLIKSDSLDVASFQPWAAELCKQVDESINPLDIVKDSVACTFSSSLTDFVHSYQEGVRLNGRKVKKYEQQTRRFEKREAKGKAADWTVASPSVIDLALVKRNILHLITNLKEQYQAKNQPSAQEDPRVITRRLIDYINDAASGMVLSVTKRAARNKALKLMEEVGISEPRKRYRQYPFEFSGGMRQRIVIAIALAANPDILICDEPTTALDVTIQAQILELINKLKRERNLSIIFITHDLGVVANMADRIAVMYAGKIVECGTSQEIFYSPAHPYTWALLSSMPNLETKERLEAIPGTPPNLIYPPKGDAFAERNRYAMEIDFKQEPPAFPITQTHWAATWLLHPDAPKIQPPKALTERIEKMMARMEVNPNA